MEFLFGRIAQGGWRTFLTPSWIVVVGLAIGLTAALSAKLAIVGALGTLFLVIAARSLAIGACLFVVVTFFDRSAGLQSGGLTMVKAMGAALTLVWLIEIGANRREAPLLFRSHPRVRPPRALPRELDGLLRVVGSRSEVGADKRRRECLPSCTGRVAHLHHFHRASRASSHLVARPGLPRRRNVRRGHRPFGCLRSQRGRERLSALGGVR